MPPFERREGILLCTGQSVCPFVTFSFPINNSRTPRPTFLHTSVLGSRGTYSFWGYWVKGQSHGGQMCQNHFQLLSKVSISQNEFLLHTFVHLILNWLIQNICDKKVLWGIMFYEHLLLLLARICQPGIWIVKIQILDNIVFVILINFCTPFFCM